MTKPQEAFGARLRREREGRGITLDAIVKSTKINRSLLEALERNDLSQWPVGIFRRAFLRAYAAAIGLPVEPLVAEFVQLFPEPGQEDKSKADTQPGNLRLTLASEQRQWFGDRAMKLLAAAADAAAVVVLAAVFAALTKKTIWPALGVVALVYYTVATAWWGQTAAGRWLNRTSSASSSKALPSRRGWSVRVPTVARLYRVTFSNRRRTNVQTASRLLGS